MAVFLMSSCYFNFESENGANNVFSYDLRGTWEPNDDSIYKGSLLITYNRITINGFLANQTPSGGDDNKRPFRGITRNIPLKAYSEDGKIFIEDMGSLLNGINYTYSKVGIWPQQELLRFSFGGSDFTFQKQK